MTATATGAAEVLVLNAGSSSLKFQLIHPHSGHVRARGLVERIGHDDAAAAITAGDTDQQQQWTGPVADHAAALAVATDLLAGIGITLHGNGLRAVGHRVVHGGSRFRQPTLIDSDVVATVRDLARLAPLHNRANADLIVGALETFPTTPQVAVFDTAFFASLPDVATRYAIDRTVAEQHKIRRFGFHGISHQYVSEQAAELLDRDVTELNQIVLHLGNGASASAIRGGTPVDTSMGLTPLEGLVMGTRSGDIDPGALLHLMRSGSMSADDLDQLLNHRSGLKGLAGSNDMRDIRRLAAAGNTHAQQAIDTYCYRARKYLGAYLAVLGRVDTVVFTAGIGENDPATRAGITAGLDALGIVIDPHRNTAPHRGPRIISPDDAPIRVLVIPTNEELAIAREAAELSE